MGGRSIRSALAAFCLLATSAIASGCNSGESSAGQDNGTVLLTGEGAPTDTPIRECDSAVFGTLASNWREYATRAGPISWLGISGYATDPPATFAEREGSRYLFKKALAVVESGALVKVEIPETERDRLSLYYSASGTRPDNLYKIGEGKRTWAFRGCDDRPTQFNGGFIVGGAQCAALDVFMEGKWRAVRVVLPFGRRACP
jgi:hypothetical protein